MPSYTWSRVGERSVVPREDTKSRRVHVLGAPAVGGNGGLLWETTCSKVDAGMLLQFVCTRLTGPPRWPSHRPAGPVPARAPSSSTTPPRTWPERFKGRRDELAAIGVRLFNLPPRSPKLQDIEHIWRSAKYEDYPVLTHTTIDAIGAAVDQALTRQHVHVQRSAANFTKAA